MVSGEMRSLARVIGVAVSEMEAVISRLPKRELDPTRLATLAEIVAKFFERLLLVHPYANGNGHAARILVIALFGRFGYWLKRWSIHPRPLGASYLDSLRAYRRGATFELREYFLSFTRDAEIEGSK
jgi:fido (protein-threonine AMPylation protein)